MHTMTDAQSAKFVAALDRVDAALTAIRHEFEELARRSAEKLADLEALASRCHKATTDPKADAASRMDFHTTDHREAATA